MMKAQEFEADHGNSRRIATLKIDGNDKRTIKIPLPLIYVTSQPPQSIATVT
jgi:hypothetical protein